MDSYVSWLLGCVRRLGLVGWFGGWLSSFELVSGMSFVGIGLVGLVGMVAVLVVWFGRGRVGLVGWLSWLVGWIRRFV